jgi:hypothetical protein
MLITAYLAQIRYLSIGDFAQSEEVVGFCQKHAIAPKHPVEKELRVSKEEHHCK